MVNLLVLFILLNVVMPKCHTLPKSKTNATTLASNVVFTIKSLTDIKKSKRGIIPVPANLSLLPNPAGHFHYYPFAHHEHASQKFIPSVPPAGYHYHRYNPQQQPWSEPQKPYESPQNHYADPQYQPQQYHTNHSPATFGGIPQQATVVPPSAVIHSQQHVSGEQHKQVYPNIYHTSPSIHTQLTQQLSPTISENPSTRGSQLQPFSYNFPPESIPNPQALIQSPDYVDNIEVSPQKTYVNQYSGPIPTTLYYPSGSLARTTISKSQYPPVNVGPQTFSSTASPVQNLKKRLFPNNSKSYFYKPVSFYTTTSVPKLTKYTQGEINFKSTTESTVETTTEDISPVKYYENPRLKNRKNYYKSTPSKKYNRKLIDKEEEDEEFVSKYKKPKYSHRNQYDDEESTEYSKKTRLEPEYFDYDYKEENRNDASDEEHQNLDDNNYDYDYTAAATPLRLKRKYRGEKLESKVKTEKYKVEPTKKLNSKPKKKVEIIQGKYSQHVPIVANGSKKHYMANWFYSTVKNEE